MRQKKNLLRLIISKIINWLIVFFQKQRKLSGIKSKPKNIFIRISRYLDKFSTRYLFYNDNIKILNNKSNIYFISSVWGEKFIEIFFTTSIPSILQEGNLNKLLSNDYKCHFFIYTNDKNEFLKHATKYPSFEILRKKVECTIYDHKDYLRNGSNSVSQVCSDAYYFHAKKCIASNAYFFVINVDHIYGNHSFINILNLVRGKKASIATCHLRVDYNSFIKSYPKFFHIRNGIINNKYENDELVNITFQHLHEFSKLCNDQLDENCTNAGVSWRKINDHTYSLVHALPCLLLMQYNESDLPWLEEYDNFTLHDRGWPIRLLHEGRMKIVSSSDIFYSFELSFSDDNKYNTQKNLEYNDQIKDPLLQSIISNCLPITLRGRQN